MPLSCKILFQNRKWLDAQFDVVYIVLSTSFLHVHPIAEGNLGIWWCTLILNSTLLVSTCLQFVDVGYTLAKKRRHSTWDSSGKKILHGITGCVVPGEMLALMGPSGSGKTTLLNLLGGRNQPDDVNTMKGMILYDGAPYSKTLKPRWALSHTNTHRSTKHLCY